VLCYLLDVVSIKKDAQPRKILQEKSEKNFSKTAKMGKYCTKNRLRFVRR